MKANEQYLFEGPDRTVLLKVPLKNIPYPYYPIRVKLLNKTTADIEKGYRTLMSTPFAFVEGWVEIGGRKTLVKYEFDLKNNSAYPNYGWIGMDVNGDGVIDENAINEEHTFAKDENVIFHVNGHDVSTVSLDVKTGRLVLREHAASENRRILLRKGVPVPDFEFVDLDGKRHQFSEFRGKYVLLDFWGTWCSPCREELPNLEKIYQQFRSRNFILLGMNEDRDVAKARLVLQEAGVTFPQSTGDEGNDLVYKRFRVDMFPIKVLLDPTGKIIETHEALHGDLLIPALEQQLPKLNHDVRKVSD